MAIFIIASSVIFASLFIAHLVLKVGRFASPVWALTRWRVEVGFNVVAAVFFAVSMVNHALKVFGVLESTSSVFSDSLISVFGAFLSYLHVKDIYRMFQYVGMSAQVPPPPPPAREAVPAGQDGPDGGLSCCRTVPNDVGLEFQDGVLTRAETVANPSPAGAVEFRADEWPPQRWLDTPPPASDDLRPEYDLRQLRRVERPTPCRPGTPPPACERNDGHEAV